MTRSRRLLGAAALSVVGALLSVCGPAQPVSEATPSPPVASPTAVATPSPTPLVSPVACAVLSGGAHFPGGSPRPHVVDVRAEEQGAFDRVTIEFSGPGVPAYQIEPNPTAPAGGTTFVESPKGDVVVLGGSYGVLVKIEDLDWLADTYAHGRDLKPGLSLVDEVRVTSDFEAIATLGIGLARRACPTATRLDSPLRLVIDFPRS